MDALWFEAIRFYELPLSDRWNLLIAQREKLLEQQIRLELLQQELVERQALIERKRQALQHQRAELELQLEDLFVWQRV